MNASTQETDLHNEGNEKTTDLHLFYREPRSFTWKQNSKLILDSVEEYARRWAKKEDVEVDTLSEWVKSVMSLVNRRVSVLSRTMSRRHESVFDDQDVAAELAEIHEKFSLFQPTRHLATLCLFAKHTI